MLTGPSGAAVVKPDPAWAQPSPLISWNRAVIPAVDGSAFRTSWEIRPSPESNVDPSGQGLSLSCHTVASIGVVIRKWTPLTSALPLPTVRTIFPLVSEPAPMGVHSAGAGSSSVPYVQSAPGSDVSPALITSLSPVWGRDVFTTPVPQADWSTRPQRPPRIGTLTGGT